MGPYRLTFESLAGDTVRVAIWHRADEGDWQVQVGGTLPRTGYTTWAETYEEALTFALGEVQEHAVARF
jgi:hypothetical protein